MSFVGSGTTGSEAAQKFLEQLQSDFRTLSSETKKKNPQIKEVRKQFVIYLSLVQISLCNDIISILSMHIFYPRSTKVAYMTEVIHNLILT